MKKQDTNPQVVEFMNRYLDQEYLGTRQAQESNLTILRKTCSHFNVQDKLCRCCRYYSTHVQEAKLGFVCIYWGKMFGVELRKFIERLAIESVSISSRFIVQWRNRSQPKNASAKPTKATGCPVITMSEVVR